MARQSKKVLKGITTEQYNEALAVYAKKDAAVSLMVSKMDNEINKIRDKYDSDINALNEEKEAAFEVVQTYCEEKQAEMFDKTRSVDTVFGKVGFRTGTPKLKLGRGASWAKVLDNLKSYLPGYVRISEEPAKDRLLIDRELPEVKEALPKCGLVVDQDERFFIDLKKEEAAA